MKRYHEGQFGFINKTDKCKHCEFLFTWFITEKDKKTGEKVYSCILYQPLPESIKDINKIASFCKLSKDKNNYTNREEIKKTYLTFNI